MFLDLSVTYDVRGQFAGLLNASRRPPRLLPTTARGLPKRACAMGCTTSRHEAKVINDGPKPADTSPRDVFVHLDQPRVIHNVNEKPACSVRSMPTTSRPQTSSTCPSREVSARVRGTARWNVRRERQLAKSRLENPHGHAADAAIRAEERMHIKIPRYAGPMIDFLRRSSLVTPRPVLGFLRRSSLESRARGGGGRPR